MAEYYSAILHSVFTDIGDLIDEYKIVRGTIEEKYKNFRSEVAKALREIIKENYDKISKATTCRFTLTYNEDPHTAKYNLNIVCNNIQIQKEWTLNLDKLYQEYYNVIKETITRKIGIDDDVFIKLALIHFGIENILQLNIIPPYTITEPGRAVYDSITVLEQILTPVNILEEVIDNIGYETLGIRIVPECYISVEDNQLKLVCPEGKKFIQSCRYVTEDTIECNMQELIKEVTDFLKSIYG